MSLLALDIGGANLKAADGLGWARSIPFALWRELKRLSAAVRELVTAAPPSQLLAITMTGELCDCFSSKVEGVRYILAAVQDAAGSRDVRVYLQTGRLVSFTEAMETPLLAAASNWHALATFACRYVGEHSAILIDVGSTTTDIIPITDGRVIAQGPSDTERLLAGELVYTGIGRTPVSAIVRALPYRGAACPVAAENFATTADAFLILRQITEQPEAMSSADGRPLSRDFARERLARMICADAATFSDQDAKTAAETIVAAQLGQLLLAGRKVISTLHANPQAIVVSGAGEFLATRLAAAIQPHATLVSLASELGARTSSCAPAHALAVLAHEWEGR